MLQVAGVRLVTLGIRLGYVCGGTLLGVGVVDRRSEEQGVEAGSSATQLAVRQLADVPLSVRPFRAENGAVVVR
jgi:hypothetical protein